MTRQPCTRTAQAKEHMPAGLIIMVLVGLSVLGWALAQLLLHSLSTFLPLAPPALIGYLVLRTQWA